MLSIIYISEVTEPLLESELQHIFKTAKQQNHVFGISGYIWFAAPHFVQYIEGDDDKVSQLMLNIENDNRHEILTRYIDTEHTKKRFAAWNIFDYASDTKVKISNQTIMRDQMLYLLQINEFSVSLNANIWKLVDNFASRCNAGLGR